MSDLQELPRRAVHEAGHAVLLWRCGATVYGDAFDRFAPFQIMLVSPNDGTLLLADGRQHDARGRVVAGYRLSRVGALKI